MKQIRVKSLFAMLSSGVIYTAIKIPLIATGSLNHNSTKTRSTFLVGVTSESTEWTTVSQSGQRSEKREERVTIENSIKTSIIYYRLVT